MKPTETTNIGKLRSVHTLRKGYKGLFLAVCGLLGLVALSTLFILADSPAPGPGNETASLIFKTTTFLLLVGPFLYSIVHLFLVWGRKLEVYEGGIKFCEVREDRFVAWNQIRHVDIRRTTTSFRNSVYMEVGQSQDMKARLILEDGSRIKIHSGIDNVETVLSLLNIMASRDTDQNAPIR